AYLDLDRVVASVPIGQAGAWLVVTNDGPVARQALEEGAIGSRLPRVLEVPQPARVADQGRSMTNGRERNPSAVRLAEPNPLVHEASTDGMLAQWRVPPAGFEPAISALKGLRPGPLDDEGALPGL